MKTTSIRLLPLAAALALFCGVAVGQTSGTSSSGSAGTGSSVTGGAAPAVQPGAATRNSESKKGDQLARDDRKFIQEAAEGGMFEVQAGQLAASKATDPTVKSFGDMLAKDHGAANNELVQLATSKKVELPAGPSRSKRSDLEKLGKLSGNAFDQRFVREVGIKDHEKDIKMFEKASGKVKDAELKGWIDKTLPTLRQHLAQAQRLPQMDNKAAAMGNRGAGPGGTGGGSGEKKGGS